MKPTAVLLTLAILAVSGCTPSETADPDPEIRSLCEIRCVSARNTCRLPSYDCDRAARACRQNCADGF